MLKIEGAQFLSKIHFCTNLGKKGPKIGYFDFFFENSVIFSKKTIQIEISFIILDFPSETPCLAKFLFLNYCPQCSLPVGFLSDHRIL